MHPNKFHSFVIGAILLVAPATVGDEGDTNE